MPYPQRPVFPRSIHVQPPRARHTGPVLGVGRRVFVSGPGTRPVMLTDEKGTVSLASLGDGAEVEIQAWQPRGAGGIRYRVRSMNDGVEGWLGAASLRPSPLPTPGGRHDAPRGGGGNADGRNRR